jgi:hypothetical protein
VYKNLLYKKYLNKSIENLEYLFLDEDRLIRLVRKKLDETILKNWQEMLHCCYQWTPLFWFLVPMSRNTN